MPVPSEKPKYRPAGRLAFLYDRLMAAHLFAYKLDCPPEDAATQLHGAASEPERILDSRRRSVEIQLLPDGSYQFRIDAWTRGNRRDMRGNRDTRTATASGTVQWDNGSTWLEGIVRIDPVLFLIIAGILLGVAGALSTGTISFPAAFVLGAILLFIGAFGRWRMITHRNDILQAIDDMVQQIYAEGHLKDKIEAGGQQSEQMAGERKKRR
jgi:hypothetical protein